MLSPAEWVTVRLSLEVAAAATLLCLPFAVALAWLLARTQFFGKAILDALVHAPLVLPPVVVGFVLLVLFGTRGPIGAWLLHQFDVRIVFTTSAAVIATAVMALPLMVRAIRLSFDAVDRGLEVAARTLGASRLDVFCTVTLPLIAPGILSGAIIGCARALGEFGATITFASNIEGQTRTLPLALYTATQTAGGDADAWRLVVISMVLALVALGLSGWLETRLRTWLSGNAPT